MYKLVPDRCKYELRRNYFSRSYIIVPICGIVCLIKVKGKGRTLVIL